MKSALITGSGCDIGIEAGKWLSSMGYKVLAHEFSSGCPEAKNAKTVFAKQSIEHTFYYADFSSVDSVVAMCDQIIENESDLEIIINLAGGSTAFGHDKIRPEQIVNAVNVNLVSPMIITHKLLPLLTEGSLVVNTAALSAFHSGWYPTDACFDAAKGGILRFTENMARNLGPKTRVNCVVIGLSYVDDNYKAWRKDRESQFPMGRIAYPKDYIKCLEFFVNHDYITGVSLPLDGGWMSYNVNPPFNSSMMERN